MTVLPAAAVLRALLAETRRVPALMTVVPVKVLAPERVSVPAPVSVSVPAPETTPA